MPSLPQVLQEATTQGATEVTLEADQHPMVRTEAGTVSVGDPLSESELFDALGHVLEPDQQAELALGNTVSFALELEGHAWSFVAEPAPDGIIVRGRASPIDDGSAASPSARALDLPKLDEVEPERAEVPSVAKSPLRGTRRRTQWDMGVPEAPVEQPRRPTPPPSKPAWSKQLGEGGTSEFEIRTPTGEQPANLIDAHDDLSASDPELAQIVVPPKPEASPVPQPTLQDFAEAVGPGTLCIVQGDDAEALAAALEGGEYVLIDDPDPGGVLRAAAEVEPGARFAVQLEDPSLVLGWLLRRLEEGSRVVVQSRALTGPGARRVLLGTGATDRAERWLSQHALVWFARSDSGWTMHPL